MSTSKLARLFAELVGTFVLTGVVLSVGQTYGTPLFTTLAAAVTFAVLVSTLGKVSGGHFNPAITLAMFSIRRISLVKSVLYVAVQAVGAVLAWKLFEWLSPDRPIALAATEFSWQVFTAELVGTAIFVMGFAAVIYRKMSDGFASATIGMSLFAGSLAMSVVILNRQIVSGILNPAVAIGTGFRPENQSYLAYFFGPVIGAILGMALYKMFFTEEALKDKSVAAQSSTVVAKSARKTATKKKTVAKKPATRRRTTK